MTGNCAIDRSRHRFNRIATQIAIGVITNRQELVKCKHLGDRLIDDRQGKGHRMIVRILTTFCIDDRADFVMNITDAIGHDRHGIPQHATQNRIESVCPESGGKQVWSKIQAQR